MFQDALQSGCSACGVELMEKTVGMACEQRAQMTMRTQMWGVHMGDLELEQVNILENPRANELIARAGDVLVNNKVFGEKRKFPPSLFRLPLGTKQWCCTVNEAIWPKFLDFNEGALVISLEPFVASGVRAVTESNVDDICVILDMFSQDYHSTNVSWGTAWVSSNIHCVNRTGYAGVRPRFGAVRRRSTRSRWQYALFLFSSLFCCIFGDDLILIYSFLLPCTRKNIFARPVRTSLSSSPHVLAFSPLIFS